MMQLKSRIKPDWLKIQKEVNDDFISIRKILKNKKLHTVCEEAKCPNRGECWRKHTATIMILGDKCTRACNFCAIGNDPSGFVDAEESRNVAEAVKLMNLKYCVLTSVTRDDLEDSGANIWAMTIKNIKLLTPKTKVEVLIPDFQGNQESLKIVLNAQPDVLSHNLETVRELYSLARPAADYKQSLQVLYQANQYGAVTKTGIMVGLGETFEQVKRLFQDVFETGCKIITIGQYLQPTQNHLDVKEYVTPAKFDEYKRLAHTIGFKAVMSGPLVRSSYCAEELAELAK